MLRDSSPWKPWGGGRRGERWAPVVGAYLRPRPVLRVKGEGRDWGGRGGGGGKESEKGIVGWGGGEGGGLCLESYLQVSYITYINRRTVPS